MVDTSWAVGLVRTGRAWEQKHALAEQKLVGEHMAYLGRLIDAGEVTQAGPVIGLDDGPGADGLVALIVYAVDVHRARTIADEDPCRARRADHPRHPPLVHGCLTRPALRLGRRTC